MLSPAGDLGPGASTRRLLEALRSGRLRLARLVLEALEGAPLDCRAGEQGRTPLMAAVLLPEPGLRLAALRLLLDRGACPDLRDDAGRSALSLACEEGFLEAAQLLVQRGADPEAPDARGWSPLMHAAARGHQALLEWLLRAFRRLGHLALDRPDRAGRTALQLAALGGHKGCVQALRAATAGAPRLPREQQGQEKQQEEGEEGPPRAPPAPGSPAQAPPAPRRPTLLRRATAPDAQSLLGCY
ncbi:ankyrin repeat domain-containing protein 63 [Sceloporus undulatus]|uniref:ankyrin repeat domain-containing protein 63 n=1 Tax=Sceloporus undulatus TaxID=8520 RepID=UPI001C4CBBAF|nr:ankyrin repeat domain-containing protein 63 [Sceloporus undulatus]